MHTLLLTLNLKIKPNQIRNFRAAILELTGIEKDVFHNRKNDSEQWGNPIERYPKIQYRIQDGYAQIWAMNEGAKALKKLIKNHCIKGLNLMDVEQDVAILQHTEVDAPQATFSKQKKCYIIKKWIPFNDEKYETYKQAANFKERLKLLEQLLLNEIILFSYAAQWTLKSTEKIKVEINDIHTISKAKYTTYNKENNKRIERNYRAYTLSFWCNATLPENIALGRHKSVGYGVVNSFEE